MKRDFNLVRMILQDIENAEPMQTFNGFTFKGYDVGTVIGGYVRV